MEAAGGQRVSAAKRWPFRLDMADLQVNKQRGCSGGGADDDMIRDRSHFKSFGVFYAICTDGQPTPQKITSHACLNTAV